MEVQIPKCGCGVPWKGSCNVIFSSDGAMTKEARVSIVSSGMELRRNCSENRRSAVQASPSLSL